MASKKLTFADAVKLASGFAGVEESTAWGSPALKVRGKMMAVVPTHRSAEPDSLAVSVDFVRRAELIEEAPEIYYVKPHYESYPVVLVRLRKINAEALRDLLGGAWRFVTAKKKPQTTKNDRLRH